MLCTGIYKHPSSPISSSSCTVVCFTMILIMFVNAHWKKVSSQTWNQKSYCAVFFYCTTFNILIHFKKILETEENYWTSERHISGVPALFIHICLAFAWLRLCVTILPIHLNWSFTTFLSVISRTQTKVAPICGHIFCARCAITYP